MEYGFDSAKARKFPPMVQLTITNVCNMACNHCPHPVYRKKNSFKPSFMEMEIYREIIDEIAMYDSSLRIFGWGEPLIHPQLIEMIEYAKYQNIEMTNLITNGLALNEELSLGLVEAGLDVLEISLDAFTPKTYEKIRGSARDFDRIVRNVHRYIELRDELNGHTFIAVSIIKQPKALDEVIPFKDYWSEIVDDVIIRTFHDFMGYAQDREKIELPKRYPCRCLWSRFNINSEGLITLCFNDWDKKSVLGNMNDPKTTIEKIWKSKDYKDYRRSHLENKPKGICANCKNWIGASWELPYEVLIQKARKNRK